MPGEKRVYVHRLVAAAFIGTQPKDKVHVAHKDGDRLNNCLGNLYYASHIENAADRLRHGRYRNGSSLPWSKLSERDIPIIRQMIEGGTTKTEAAMRFHVARSTIAQIISGKTWSHF